MFLYFIGWFIGVVFGAFFVIQPLIILFFSIPYTFKLRRIGALGINVPVHTRDLISFFVQIGLFILFTWIIRKFNHNILIGYYVGVGFSLLFGITKVFKTKLNVADYIENKLKYLHPEFLKEYVNTLLNTEPESKWLNQHLNVIQNKTNIEL